MHDGAASLLALYRSIGLDPPRWAYPLPPSIPFLGKDYGRWGGVLVYGSAENLAHYERRPETIPDLLRDDRALNRHRVAFTQSRDEYFPAVHMAPFDNGSLLVAVWYYLWRTGGDPPNDPRSLIDSIAAANFCKFSIAGARNKDYVGNREKLLHSLPYAQADLALLQPAIIILPRAIWKHADIGATIVANRPQARVLPLPQFNSQVVNMHLMKHATRVGPLERELRGTVLPSWISRMKGYASGTPYRFLIEMDDVIAEVAVPSASTLPSSP